MSDLILSVNEISKSYQTSRSEKLKVLNSVDLSIGAGDLVGLTAPSGAESLLSFISVVYLILVMAGQLIF